MKVQEILSVIAHWLLRLGVIAFFVPVLIDLWQHPGFEDEFWFWFFRIFYIVAFVGLVLIALLLRTLKFYNYGFSFVFVYSVFKIADLTFKYGWHNEHAVYFLLLVTSFYFMTKSERLNKRQRRFD